MDILLAFASGFMVAKVTNNAVKKQEIFKCSTLSSKEFEEQTKNIRFNERRTLWSDSLFQWSLIRCDELYPRFSRHAIEVNLASRIATDFPNQDTNEVTEHLNEIYANPKCNSQEQYVLIQNFLMKHMKKE